MTIVAGGLTVRPGDFAPHVQRLFRGLNDRRFGL
jgi:hypothetical protein